jgi:solute carrier family 25 carnitine/acylcarnitine transporter 20/29
MFAVNGTIKRWLAAGLGVEKTQLSLPYVCVAAWLTAPVYALLLTPIEVVKARLQFQSAGVEQLYRGPVDLILKTARAEGLAGFYHGYTATVLTRLIGSPFYFVSYEVTKRAFQPADPAAPLPSSAILVAGGVGGTVFWAANFPADLVKTRLQTRRTTTPVSLSSVVKEVYRTDGLRGFYRGFTPCIIRAAPANAVAFWGLETTMRALGGKEGF